MRRFTWIPAFAGMTIEPRRNDRSHRMMELNSIIYVVIPTKVGIHSKLGRILCQMRKK